MSKKRILLSLVLAGLYVFPGVFACAQAYTTIVVFGDSLSDTGNDAAVSYAKYGATYAVPTPTTGYTQGSFTDGLDTSPAARNYTGVWVKQLAALLPAKPSLTNSLSGGTDYAYGFGTTDVGTSDFTYGPGNVLSFTVNNMGQQVADYLATHPTINNKVLFVVWGGANDLINATSSADIAAAAQRDAGIVQTLIAAGATDILVPNLPPLGLVPRFNGSAASSTEPTEAAEGFNQALAAYLAGIIAADPSPNLHIFQLDVFTIFNTIVGPPTVSGFANVTASSQGNSSINPDTYLFWDDLHPTTYGHSILAANAFALIGTPIVTTATVASNNIDANLNASVTVTASVTANKGTPIGYVTFLDGTTALGSALLSGSGTTATATYISSTLTAGTHNITASYSGENGYVGSTSSDIFEVVTAPSFSSQLNVTSINAVSGQTVEADITLTPVGGYTGTVNLACSTAAPHISCVVGLTSMTFTGNNIAQAALLTINTMSTTQSASLSTPPNAPHGGDVMAAFLLLPGLGLLGLASLRKRRPGVRALGSLLIVAAFSGAALLSLTGCGNGTNPNDTKPGTYTVLVTETAGTTVTTQTLNVVVTPR